MVVSGKLLRPSPGVLVSPVFDYRLRAPTGSNLKDLAPMCLQRMHTEERTLWFR